MGLTSFYAWSAWSPYQAKHCVPHSLYFCQPTPRAINARRVEADKPQERREQFRKNYPTQPTLRWTLTPCPGFRPCRRPEGALRTSPRRPSLLREKVQLRRELEALEVILLEFLGSAESRAMWGCSTPEVKHVERRETLRHLFFRIVGTGLGSPNPSVNVIAWDPEKAPQNSNVEMS